MYTTIYASHAILMRHFKIILSVLFVSVHICACFLCCLSFSSCSVLESFDGWQILILCRLFKFFSDTFIASLSDLTRIPGVTCSASSEYRAEFGCAGAYSGVAGFGNYNDWAALNEVHGIWIRLDFHQIVLITNVTWWPRCDYRNQFSRVEIETNSPSTVMVSLNMDAFHVFKH